MPATPSRWLPQTIRLRPAAARPRAAVAILAGPDPAPLVRCLGALALQRSAEGLWLARGAFGAVIQPTGPAAALEAALRGIGPALPFPLRVLAAPAPPGEAWALRAALEAAQDWAGGGAVLATSAEAVPEARWVAHAHAALAGGAALALGEVMPPGGGQDPAGRYAGLLARLAARLDPDPAEPHPAHGQDQALSFGIAGPALRSLGGLPAGLDGGFAGLLAVLRRRDARIRHVAGMRVEAALPPAPVEPAIAAWRRLRARRRVREFWAAGIGVHAAETPEFRRLAARLGLPAGALGRALATPAFGAAWAAVEATSPALAAHPLLPPAALPREMRRARLLLAAAGLGRSAAPAQRPGGLPPGGTSPGGSCRLRYPAGGSNRAGSCGP